MQLPHLNENDIQVSLKKRELKDHFGKLIVVVVVAVTVDVVDVVVVVVVVVSMVLFISRQIFIS